MGLLDLFKRDRRARALSERDAPADPGTSQRASDDEYVGRVGSDDSLDVGETGAERRAAEDS